LTEISSRIANASYNVRRIPAIIIRKLNPRGTVMLFRTGKALVVGVERVDSVEKIAKRIAKDLTNILHYGKVEVH
jgi:TATA-box binding protein (TBP) (component of TFIID and TFIIIB)